MKGLWEIILAVAFLVALVVVLIASFVLGGSCGNSGWNMTNPGFSLVFCGYGEGER